MGEASRVYPTSSIAFSTFAFAASTWARAERCRATALSSSAWLTARCSASGLNRFTSRVALDRVDSARASSPFASASLAR